MPSEILAKAVKTATTAVVTKFVPQVLESFLKPVAAALIDASSEVGNQGSTRIREGISNLITKRRPKVDIWKVLSAEQIDRLRGSPIAVDILEDIADGWEAHTRIGYLKPPDKESS